MHVGTNIAKIVDVEAVANFVSDIPNVVLAKTYKYMCSNPGQEMITQDIKENHLNRVVVAACSPNMHERTFRKPLDLPVLTSTFSKWPISVSNAAGFIRTR